MKSEIGTAVTTAAGYDTIIEGKAKICVPRVAGGKISSKMPVFYNQAMKSNRDITMLFLAAAADVYKIRKFRAADPMAATGIRGVRMLLEAGKVVESVTMNDYSEAAVKLIKKNLRLNKLKLRGGSNGGKVAKAAVENKDANIFLLTNRAFSYIDLDPFGYPGIFLDAAIKKLANNGILAVTATDTSALAGSAAAACRRKYLATPLKNSFMHETGVRILIRLVQLIGAMHEKALTPVFSYYKEHYTRAFFFCRMGAQRADELLRMHKEISYCNSCCKKKVLENDGDKAKCASCSGCGKKMEIAGPLWAGRLFDTKLAQKMARIAAMTAAAGEAKKKAAAVTDDKMRSFLTLVAEEARNEGKCGTGFYATEDVCEKYKVAQQPKTGEVIARLRKAGYAASPTHCSATGVKTNANIAAVVAAVKVRKVRRA